MRALWRPTLAASLAAITALAQPATPSGWTTGYNQGVIEAIVRVADGSYVGFACSTAGSNAGVSLSAQMPGRAVADLSTLRLIVDDRSYQFDLADGLVRGGDGREELIREVAAALAHSASPSFVAEIPEAGWQQEFAVAGARQALTDGLGNTFLDACRR